MSRPIGVLGGGRFGRAIAIATQRAGHEVTLVSRVLASDAIPDVQVVRSLEALSGVELVFVCVPSHATSVAADELAPHLDGRHRLVHVSRGLVGDELRTLCDVLRDHTPSRRVGVLAGPLVAEALERGLPGGAIVGSRFPEVAAMVREAFAAEPLRIYETDDVLGVEFASAAVGVLSVAVGIARGLGVGPAALATLVTRGVNEAARFGESFGANRTTFGGLAGMGDLVAVVAGDRRPELRLGEDLANGRSLAEATNALETHVESPSLVPRLVVEARRRNLHLPILEALDAVLAGRLAAAESWKTLMGHAAGREA